MYKMTCGHPSSKQAHIVQYGTMSDCSSYTSQPPKCHKNVSGDIMDMCKEDKQAVPKPFFGRNQGGFSWLTFIAKPVVAMIQPS